MIKLFSFPQCFHFKKITDFSPFFACFSLRLLRLLSLYSLVSYFFRIQSSKKLQYLNMKRKKRKNIQDLSLFFSVSCSITQCLKEKFFHQRMFRSFSVYALTFHHGTEKMEKFFIFRWAQGENKKQWESFIKFYVLLLQALMTS